jgi:NAD-specific glutamate dehydrogenase
MHSTECLRLFKEPSRPISTTTTGDPFCTTPPHLSRYALSLRVDPRVMLLPEDLEGPKQKEVPFGVFFSHGRYFNGFHCRFRDIARGGLRIVTPPNSDTKSFESGRHFDEVYGLSYGQQLKNKDIPEGGAKAVVLVDSPSVKEKHHEFLKRKCVRVREPLLSHSRDDSHFSRDLWIPSWT